ncbi:MAG: hypothetical protein DRN37_02860 [Thermoplasmata archaeon]|nr:MAG: hypothetical protein DRN37_02860 [Thermoplasmata archaeon]
MLKQIWITGILMAFSVFGVKVGLGLAPHLYNKRLSIRRRSAALLCTLLSYLLLFSSLFLLITRFNLLNYLDQFVKMLRYGMLLHLFMAVGLLIWGLKLLLQAPGQKDTQSNRSSILLIFPCPVCATVILLNLSFAYSMFDLSPFLTVLILFALFWGIVFLTIFIVLPFRQNIGNGNSFLGAAMGLISLYFLLTVIIAPIYQEIKRAFAMASSNSPVDQVHILRISILVFFVLVLGAAGFIRNYFARGETE